MLGELDIELIFKIVLTSFALIINMLTFLGVKYANLKVRYAVRGTILSFAMVLLAYIYRAHRWAHRSKINSPGVYI